MSVLWIQMVIGVQPKLIEKGCISLTEQIGEFAEITAQFQVFHNDGNKYHIAVKFSITLIGNNT